MGSYAAEWPDTTFDPDYKKFFEDFYAISDDPNGHEKYAEQFTSNAVFIVASKKAQGTAEIITMRHGMWEKVASRKHKPWKIFPFGPNSDEVMLFGSVEYGLKAGGGSVLEWGARANLTKENGKVKMTYYQDTGAQSK